METENQACCAHCKVVLKRQTNPDGTLSDYWECSDSCCGTRFIPVSEVLLLREENKRLKKDLDDLDIMYKELEEKTNWPL